jgi:NADH/NAD ratio-sensing transcriptional regulator Rex
LIESIYLDVDTASADASRVSRYTLLIEKLAAAESAQKMHAEMSRRIAKRHAQHVAQVRKDLEAEGQRLRDLIRVTKANG